MGGFRAPVSYQAGGLGLDPTTNQQIQGPRRPFDWEAWLQSPGTVERPTDAEYQQMSRDIAEREWAAVVNRRREALDRLGRLGDRTNMSPEQVATYNALDNSVKTLTEVQEKLEKQIQATGGTTNNVLVPLQRPDGTESGLYLNPNDPKDAPIRLDQASPDQLEITRRTEAQAREAQARSAEATARTNAQVGSQANAQRAQTLRTEMTTAAQRATAEANQLIAQTTANARIIDAQLRSGDKTLEETRQLSEQLTSLEQETQKGVNTIATEAVKGMNDLETKWFDGWIKSQEVGQLARDSFQDALSNRATAIAAQDVEDLKARSSQATEREKGAVGLVKSMWDGYVKSLEKVYDLPNGWFDAVQRGFQNKAYAHQLPQLMAMMKSPTPDMNLPAQWMQQFMAPRSEGGLYGDLERPNFRPLPEVAPEFVREPLPSIAEGMARNQGFVDQAQAGTLLPVPGSPQNPLSSDFAGPVDLRSRVPGSTPGSFTAPVAEGLLPLEEEPFPEPEPISTPDLLPEPEPLMPSFAPDPFDTGGFDVESYNPELDMQVFEPILDAAPPEYVPLVLNVLAGLSARDDVALDPERVLREEIDYAFSPFGLSYTLDPPSFWEEEEEDTFDYTTDDYGGGDFYV